MKRLYFIDGLRCIAAFSVLIQHTLETTPIGTAFNIFSPGLFGVVLFFFISGFIIPYSVGFQPNADKFVINRIFRIFPAYLMVFGMVLLLGWYGIQPFMDEVNGSEKDTLWLFSNALMLAEYVGLQPLIGVAWTLPLEFTWYFIFGLIFLLYGQRYALELTVTLSALILIACVTAVFIETRIPVGRLSLINAASVGYLFYLWNRNILKTLILKTGIIIFALSTTASFIIMYSYYPHENVFLHTTIISWGASLLVFSVILLSHTLRNSSFLNNSAICFLGEISYSIYLVHGLCIELATNVSSSYFMLILVPILTILISWLIYRLIERPGIKLGRRIASEMKIRRIEILGPLFSRIASSESQPDSI